MHPMNLLKLIAIGFTSLIVVPSYAQPAAPVAKVNGIAIPQSRLDFIMKARAAQGQADSPETRKAMREDLITEEVIAQEAKNRGLDKDSDVITQVDIARQSVLVRAYQVDYIKTHKVSDDELRKEYEELKAQMGDKEFKARHILVATENEAKDAIASIRKGSKFDKIAKDKSNDTGSKDKGGELDWSPAGTYVKPFAETLLKLKKGQMTEQPVQTSFGWHVIRLDDIRPLRVPPFEEVKQNIQQRVLQKQFAGAVNDLRTKAKIE
jgi:peptidyl-prolyl cis-trans isomerase C